MKESKVPLERDQTGDLEIKCPTWPLAPGSYTFTYFLVLWTPPLAPLGVINTSLLLVWYLPAVGKSSACFMSVLRFYAFSIGDIFLYQLSTSRERHISVKLHYFASHCPCLDGLAKFVRFLLSRCPRAQNVFYLLGGFPYLSPAEITYKS